MSRFAPPGDPAALEGGLTLSPRFDAQGLVACIATDADSGEVLMFAWMNADALSLTLSTGFAHFWSRSRRKIWQKGEESGNRLRLVEALTDCDQDVVQLKVRVEGAGVACHTGARSCFYRRLRIDPAREPTTVLDKID